MAPQVRLLRSRSDIGVISVFGLVTQVGIFGSNALSWPHRLHFDWEGWSEQDHGLRLFWKWYLCVGFIPTNTGIFAVVQGILLAIILSGQRCYSISNPEPQPLLNHAP